MKIKLFYSYCHADEKFRERMQKSMATLHENGLIDEWYDRKIIVGKPWKKSIHKELSASNIVIFLVSQDFLASPACKEEWFAAKELASKQNKALICVILRDCAWFDFDDMSDFLATPEDGKPVTSWDNEDKAWLKIYQDIKTAIEDYKESFVSKKEFTAEVSKLEFCSNSDSDISINDLFVFPNLDVETENIDQEIKIKNIDDLMAYDKCLIIGDEQSGKSKLCVHLYLQLIERNNACLFVDLYDVLHKKPTKDLLKRIFEDQFSGDFDEWIKLEGKTVIIDNFINHKNSLAYIDFLDELFDNIFISIDSDSFDSYYKDEPAFSNYKNISIKPFDLVKQEKLIRKWLLIKRKGDIVHDGTIDKIENNINEIIIDNKILPRYPFFILSILQTHEAFMPKDVRITAYGHCYYALILANLIKSGIESSDDAISSSMNFCSHLAFEIFTNESGGAISINNFNKFVENYKQKYIIKQSILNKLISDRGILKITGETYRFNLPYSYYFFLGKYLAENYKDNLETINSLVANSYHNNNSFILVFTIHHASDKSLIEEVLTHTVCALDHLEPSKLDTEETKVLLSLIKSIPKKILLDSDVQKEREKERSLMEVKTDDSAYKVDETKEKEIQKTLSQIYLAHKNIEILSQILKNKYGQLERANVLELIEVICDAGLRLVRVLSVDEAQLSELVGYIHKSLENKYDERPSIEDIKRLLITKIFIWTMGTIEKIVSSINKKEIRDLVTILKDKKNTPAYDLIHYFFYLDSSDRFGDKQKEMLEKILQKYNSSEGFFMKKILSIRTQHYFNTHKVNISIKQSVCSLLELDHKPKLIKS